MPQISQLLVEIKNYLADLPRQSANEEIMPQISQLLVEIKNYLADLPRQNANEELILQISRLLGEIKDYLSDVPRQSANEELIQQVSQFLGEIKNHLIENPVQNISSGNVDAIIPQMSQILEDTKNCVNSFAEIAKEIHEADEKKFSTLEELVQKNLQQQKEIEEMREKMVTYDKLKDQEKNERNRIVRNVQKVLNMLMGQIISEIEAFSKIPQYKMNEDVVAKYRYNIVQIATRADAEIKRAFTAAPQMK